MGQDPPVLSVSVDFVPAKQAVNPKSKEKLSLTVAVDIEGLISKGEVVIDGLQEPEYVQGVDKTVDVVMIIDNGYVWLSLPS